MASEIKCQHGPQHLFCSGAMQDPLADAAWAGHLAAHNRIEEAKKWEQSAINQFGKVWCGMWFGDVHVEVRVSGGEITEDAIETLGDVFDIHRKKILRKREEAPTPASMTDEEKSIEIVFLEAKHGNE